MKLFSNWIFGSKTEENDVDVEKQEMTDDKPELDFAMDDATKKNIKERLDNLHHLNITVSEDGSCNIARREGEVKWFSTKPVFEKTMSVGDVLEYIESVRFGRVGFRGPFEKTRDLMKKIDITWYGQQYTIYVYITDGLKNFGCGERHEWTRFVLRINRELFFNSRKKNDNSPAEDDSKSFPNFRLTAVTGMTSETNHFGMSENFEDVFCVSFDIYCSQMSVPAYDVIREKVLYGNVITSRMFKPEHFELAQRIIRKEAESYKEEPNIIEYVINGEKRFICNGKYLDKD